MALVAPMTTPTTISFFVPGVPKTAGSKRAIPIPGRKFPIIVDACAKSKDWKADIKAFAAAAMRESSPHTTAVTAFFSFHLPRPKCHYYSSGLVKDSAPRWHISRPDVDKLSRAVMDALTGVVWRDDGQVVSKQVSKHYDTTPGVRIIIEIAK